MKKCAKCGVEKPIFDFGKQSHKKSGIRSRCLICSRNDSKIYRAKRLELQGDNLRKKLVAVERKRLYGISQDDFDKMKLDQNHKCAICEEDLDNAKNTCVDHSHTTKKVRGILCAKCNFGLGHFKDSIQLLQSAQNYLKKYI